MRNSEKPIAGKACCTANPIDCPIDSSANMIVKEPLEAAVLRTLLYFDIFDYPLTKNEIVRHLPVKLTDQHQLINALNLLEQDGLITELKGYRFISGSSPTIVAKRLQRESRAKQLWKRAQSISSMIRHVPFVRAIFISGSLAHAQADPGGDIDYFIVTEPNRLWLVRTFLVLVRRTLFLNKRTYLCLNYFVTTDHLLITERQVYAACETASLRPIYNPSLYAQFAKKNRWITDFYPNFFCVSDANFAPITKNASAVQKIVEKLVPSRLALRLDQRLMNTTTNFWRKKYPTMTKEKRDVVLRTTRHESRAHADDYSDKILSTYAASLAKYHLSLLTISQSVVSGHPPLSNNQETDG